MTPKPMVSIDYSKHHLGGGNGGTTASATSRWRQQQRRSELWRNEAKRAGNEAIHRSAHG